MTRPAPLITGKLDDDGFGWWIDPRVAHKHVYHDGDTYGMSSSNNLFPDDDRAIIVLQNEGEDTAGKTATAIFRALERR